MYTDTFNRRISRFVLPALTLLLTLAATPPILAQQSDRGAREAMKSESQATNSEQPSAEKTSSKSQLTGRLPRYFAAVVSLEQRSEIYRIQKEYAAQMKMLQEQLAALRADEMEKMEAVLSQTQLKQVGEMRKKAKERVAARKVAASTKPQSASREKVTETANPKDKS